MNFYYDENGKRLFGSPSDPVSSTVTAQYAYFVEQGSSLRLRVGKSGGGLKVDVELTVTGFAGDEDTDWENIGGAV